MRRSLLVVSTMVLASAAGCDCGKNTGIRENHGIFHLESNELDFGPVTEFTEATLSIQVRNTGNAPLMLSATSEGAEFRLGTVQPEVPAQGAVEVPVTFAPLGPGEDTGAVVFTTDDPDQMSARVNLHGGPIWPALEFDPDGGSLSFVPTSTPLTSKYAVIRSTGGSTLHVTAAGVNAFGNPDFSVVPPALPAALKPGESAAVQVDYAKSRNAAEGLLEVVSDDHDGGLRTLRLLPDPAHACGDGLDNETAPDGGAAGDGLIDFPDDPGCTNLDDDDEYNPPECVSGASRVCGTMIGICRLGSQRCASSIWGPCDGGVRPLAESCNGLDDNCDGTADEAITELCTINGCMGARLCQQNSGVDGGVWFNCMPVASMAEQCNGLDDNCNGMVDEGIVQTCTINGCLGTRICLPGGDGGFTACQAANPATEICNGIDDDCDGTVDDVTPAIQTCGFGVCARTAPACVDGGTPTCVPGTGTTELCNGIDDDCNGVVDNGITPLTCGAAGQCLNSVPACLADGGMNVCVPNPPSAEICDNIDNDCDMSIDEMVTQPCYNGPPGTAGVGICRVGTQTCSAGAFGTCTGEVQPSTEICNNVNDDCDGLIDEQPDGGPLRITCYDAGLPATRGVGACRDGTATCMTGMFGNCVGQIGPGTEVCGNLIDDDCANGVDNGCAVDAGCTPSTWLQHHSYNPITMMPAPVQVNQFVSSEPVATRFTLPASAFPLTITHVRVLAQAGTLYTLTVYANGAGTPGGVLKSQVFMADGTYQVIPMNVPQQTFATQTTFWVGIRGAVNFYSVYGDGNGEATVTMCDSILGPWQTFDALGPPFTAVDDLILAVGQCP